MVQYKKKTGHFLSLFFHYSSFFVCENKCLEKKNMKVIILVVLFSTLVYAIPDCCQFYAPGTRIVYDPCHQESTGCKDDVGVVAAFFTSCNASKVLVCCRQSFIGTQYYMTSDSCCRAMDRTGDASYTIVPELQCKQKPRIPIDHKVFEKKQNGTDRDLGN